MYKFFWFVTLVIAFLMGYVAHQEPLQNFEDPNDPKNCVSQSTSSDASVSSSSSSAEVTASVTPSSVVAVVNTEKEMSDQAIDKLLTKPFSTLLKGSHGDTRKLYKKFAEEATSSEWGAQMHVKLTEAINANSQAQHIHLESVRCRVDLCEVLLYEAKENSWSIILTDLVKQDGWSFGQVSTLGQNLTDNPKYSMAYLVLLSKK